jgi:hypothetical protein
MIMTAIFTGLRASELRGLRWKNVDLKNAKLHVRERADRYLKMGEPKSESGERAVPLPPMIVNVLREHKLRTKADFVFPTDNGVQHHANILHRGFEPAQVAAGIVDEHGKPKYALHALRHFYASWCINRKQDGGLELPMKVVQERLGHSTINLTADVYGHLFPSNDDGDRTQRGPKVLCSLSATQTRHAARNINKNNALVQFCKPWVGSSILSPGTTKALITAEFCWIVWANQQRNKRTKREHRASRYPNSRSYQNRTFVPEKRASCTWPATEKSPERFGITAPTQKQSRRRHQKSGASAAVSLN